MAVAQDSPDEKVALRRRGALNLGLMAINPNEDNIPHPRLRPRTRSTLPRLPPHPPQTPQEEDVAPESSALDSDSQSESDTTVHPTTQSLSNVRRASDSFYVVQVGTSALFYYHADLKQPPRDPRPLPPLPPLPGHHTTPSSECVSITVTHKTQNYIVDITGCADAQAIREHQLRVTDNPHAGLDIYCTGPDGAIVGSPLDNNQLLIECVQFGDDSGSLKFLARHADPPVVTPARIGGTMLERQSATDIIQNLVSHGCQDITANLDLPSCSEFPFSSGGSGDVYRGRLRNGLRIAIKGVRILDPSGGGSEQQQKHLKQYIQSLPKERTQDNILVSNDGEPLVTDFGNAVLRERTLKFTSTTTGHKISSRWTAPELLHGDPYSFEADVYALGMTILEVVTEDVPYATIHREVAVIAAILTGVLPERPQAQIPNASTFGDALWALLNECWILDPIKRPTAAAVRDKMRVLELDEPIIR
ncbi:hypothetical protein FRC09_015714 [Ceratobasidium sp. 395]|nr:hypothetical protein FRC09_015714 [Ceratobasidium sp. 395]